MWCAIFLHDNGLPEFGSFQEVAYSHKVTVILGPFDIDWKTISDGINQIDEDLYRETKTGHSCSDLIQLYVRSRQ